VNAPQPAYSDAAKRCSDHIRLHILAGMGGKYAAIRLSDGGSDGIAYDTRRDAITHQLHEQQCAYIRIPLDSMPVDHAERFLQIQRDLYDRGFRLCDPDGPELISPITTEGLAQSLALLKGRRK
jgi:hypothetical protein